MDPTGNGQFRFPPQPRGSNMCGAYALAYWWGRHSGSPKTSLELEEKAADYYAAVQFTSRDFLPDFDCNEGRLEQYTGNRNLVRECFNGVISCCVGAGGGYCNPQAMMWKIPELGCKFYLGMNPLIWAIYVKMKQIDSDIAGRIRLEEYVENEEKDMLEVVSLKNSVGLHYLYVFTEDGVRKAIDPARGLEVGREAQARDMVIRDYVETKAAIVIG